VLNPFPIQFLSLFAYFLLRVTVALVLLVLAWQQLRSRRELAPALQLPWFPHGNLSVWILIVAEVGIAGLLLIGLYTQYAALALMIMSVKLIVFRRWFRHPAIPARLFLVLLFGAALSLFITGAGAFAFDLPI
jgi:uncharacterized membrane protein YphA (DoxX/SURF4 family)